MKKHVKLNNLLNIEFCGWLNKKLGMFCWVFIFFFGNQIIGTIQDAGLVKASKNWKTELDTSSMTDRWKSSQTSF